MEGNNKRVAKNTFFLGARLIIQILLQLFTVPLVLKNLGVSDYGLYMVIAGFVTLFHFIGGAMSSASQRYLSMELGVHNFPRLRIVFSTTLNIYIIIAVIVFVFLETIGLYFLNTQMTIPINRITEANYVYQIAIITFLVNILALPYNAVIVARERMSLFAFVSVLESFLKLCIAIILAFGWFDKLIVYSILLLAVSFLSASIYFLFCQLKFPEVKYIRSFDKELYKSIAVYSGWNMIGSLAGLARYQGLNIIMNIFFNTVVNAAHSLAQQINSVITQFVYNIYMASRPQIIKLYAAKNYEEMWRLCFFSQKVSMYILLLITIPLIYIVDDVLYLWLPDAPLYTAKILRLFLIILLLETLTNQLIPVFQAANLIKYYQRVGSLILLSQIPISYCALLLLPNIVLLPYYIALVISLFYIIVIVYLAKVHIHLDLISYVRYNVLNILIIFIFSFLLLHFSFSYFESGHLINVIVTILVSTPITSLLFWFIGFDYYERKKICMTIVQYLKKM